MSVITLDELRDVEKNEDTEKRKLMQLKKLLLNADKEFRKLKNTNDGEKPKGS